MSSEQHLQVPGLRFGNRPPPTNTAQTNTADSKSGQCASVGDVRPPDRPFAAVARDTRRGLGRQPSVERRPAAEGGRVASSPSSIPATGPGGSGGRTRRPAAWWTGLRAVAPTVWPFRWLGKDPDMPEVDPQTHQPLSDAPDGPDATRGGRLPGDEDLLDAVAGRARCTRIGMSARPWFGRP